MNTSSPRRPVFLLPLFALVVASGEAGAANIATSGTAIFGVHTGVETTLGTPFAHVNPPTVLNDGNTAGGITDTWNGDQVHAGTAFASYGGIVWGAPRTDVVDSITVTMQSFFDGGWFGPNNSGPGGQGILNDTYLIEPTVQISLDGGVTWAAVAATSNYSAAMDGVGLPVDFGPPTAATATFTLNAPVTGITGIRLIGTEGGTASGGFIGMSEFEVNAEAVPEPASLALAGVAGCLLLRRRRSAC